MLRKYVCPLLILATMATGAVIWSFVGKMNVFSAGPQQALIAVASVIWVGFTIKFVIWSRSSDELPSNTERLMMTFMVVTSFVATLYLYSNQGVLRQLRLMDLLVAAAMLAGVFFVAKIATPFFEKVFGSTHVVDPDAAQNAVPAVPLRQRFGTWIAGTADRENPKRTARGTGTLWPLPADPTITGNAATTIDPQAGPASSN